MNSSLVLKLFIGLTVVTLFVTSAHAQNPQDCHFEELFHSEARALKEENLYAKGKQEYLKKVSNREFIRADNKLKDGKTLNMHRENAVVKLLNDKIFQDIEITAATLNLDKNLFYPRLFDSKLEGSLVYNDPKSERLKISTEGPLSRQEIIQELIKIHQAVTKEFAKKLLSSPHLAKAFQQAKYRRIQNPESWYEMGIGETSAQAAQQARLRRSDPFLHKAGKDNFVFDAHSVEEVAHLARQAEHLRDLLAGKIQDHSMFEGRFPSEPMIEILRRIQNSPDVVTFGDYLKHIRAAAHRRWQDTRLLDEHTIQELQTLFRIMNELASPVWSPDQEPVQLSNMSNATHGVWAFDARGQNARNLYGVIESIHEANLVLEPGELDSEYVDRVLEFISTRQDRESERFMEAVAHLDNSLLANGIIDVKNLDSRRFRAGDDITSLPEFDLYLELEKYARTLEHLAGNGFESSLYRSMIQPQNFLSGKPIPQDLRYTMISIASGAEKNLRLALEGADSEGLVPFEQWREAALSLRLNPMDEHHVLVDLDVGTGKKKLSDAKVIEIRDKLKRYLDKHSVFPKGWEVRSVKALPELYNPNP